jgi:hypothetical protein
MRFLLATLVTVLAAAASGGELRAQTLPAGPIRTLDGRLTISGEIVGTAGAADDTAFFNYTDYENNALRMSRAALAAAWRPAEWVAFVAELRTEDFAHVDAFGAYVRIRPFRSIPLDVQAGRIPPSFGAFGRRAYATDQILIGFPLAYQYLTSLRPDSVPATADDLIRMRGRGWRPSFPIGSFEDAPGVPLITAFQWDTGVQARWIAGPLELTGALTNGTVSDPRFNDNNDAKQWSGRAAVRPVVGLVIGASAARGGFLADDVVEILPEAARERDYAQSAFGLDAEYSRDYWIVRAELVRSRWSLPLLWPAGTMDVSALGAWVEGRYKFTPRIFAAARVDHLGFSKISGSIWTSPTSWDAPVNRVEWGGGYYFQRNLVGRAVVQHNRRDGGFVRSRTFVSAQISYWF